MVRTTTAKEPVKAQYRIKAQTLLSWALRCSELEWFQGPSCKRFPVWVSVKNRRQSGSISPNLANPVTLKYNDEVLLFQYLHASFHRVVEDRAGKIRQPDLQNTKCQPKYNESTVGLCLLTQSHEQPKALCRLPCFHLHLVTYSKIHQTVFSLTSSPLHCWARCANEAIRHLWIVPFNNPNKTSSKLSQVFRISNLHHVRKPEVCRNQMPKPRPGPYPRTFRLKKNLLATSSLSEPNKKPYYSRTELHK